MNKKIISKKSVNLFPKDTPEPAEVCRPPKSPAKDSTPLFLTREQAEVILAKTPEVVAWLKQQLNQQAAPILEADISQELKRKLKDGTLSWVYDRQGRMLAQIKDGNGKILKNLRLNERELSSLQIEQQILIKAKLDQISKKLEEMARSLEREHKGQHIDRISKCYAAMDVAEKDKEIAPYDKKIRYEQALFMAAEGVSQIKASLAQEVSQLSQIKTEKWWVPFKGVGQKEINNRMKALQMYFNDLYQGVAIYASIYMKMGELANMKQVIMEYLAFLDNTFSSTTCLQLNSQVGKQSPYLDIWNTDLTKVKTSLSQILQNLPKGELLKWDNVKNVE